MAKLSDLTPDSKNANRGTQRGLRALDTSLRQYGAGRSILLDRDNRIIAGNKTAERAADIGLDDVEIVDSDGTKLIAVRRTDLDLEDDGGKARALATYDNRVGQLDLDWDVEQLGAIDFDVLNDLWMPQELEKLGVDFGEKPEDPGAQIDRAEELREKWGVASGQLWQLGAHRLICGDCTDRAVVERVMAGEKAGAVVTDPPYGQDQVDVPGDSPEEHAALMIACVENLPIENGIVIAFQSPRMFQDWLNAIRAHQFRRALWLYKEAQETYPWRGWLLKSEMILVSEVGKGEWLDAHPYAHDCYKVSEVSYSTEKIAAVRPHGSIKPLTVIQDLVSRVGGIVYDPFLGSGTTLIACERLGRKCRAVEISPAYCAVAIQRWVDMTGGEPVMLEDIAQ